MLRKTLFTSSMVAALSAGVLFATTATGFAKTHAACSANQQNKAACGCSIANDQVSPATAQKQVQAAYQQWIKTVTTAKGNPTPVVALYADQAILIPTVSNNLHFNQDMDIGRAQIRDYFVKFTALKNLQASTQKLVTRTFGNVAVNAGTYTFSYTDAQGKTVSVPARFTFVYKNMGGKWLIIDHHSSQLPE